MNNNDILRRLRFAFDINDDKMMKLFKLGGYEATRAEISDWLKKDDDPAFQGIIDQMLSIFLNGFIIEKRGKKDGVEPKAEKRMNNNMVLRKLKIALSLQDTDVLDILNLADFRLSKHELSAFFRNPNHEHYRPCKDQVLRNFLIGLQLKYKAIDDAKVKQA